MSIERYCPQCGEKGPQLMSVGRLGCKKCGFHRLCPHPTSTYIKHDAERAYIKCDYCKGSWETEIKKEEQL